MTNVTNLRHVQANKSLVLIVKFKPSMDCVMSFSYMHLNVSAVILNRRLHLSNPQCSSNVQGMEFFAGFMKSVNLEILQQVVTVLVGLTKRYHGYSVVINGHSLGGAKAMLTAAYVAKFFSREIPMAAVYTYGMPPPGNTIFNKWLADCIGPEKIVRVVSSNDLVPFSRVSPDVQHAPNVIEVYNPDSNQNVWQQCMGGIGAECSSAKNTCSQRSWENHSRIGGITFGASICSSS